MKSFKELVVWQKAMELVQEVYKLTKQFPDDERFGLIIQIRRSAISIPSNIAEGYGRNSTNDYIRFLQIARGSLYEIQTQIEISYNLLYINEKNYQNMSEQLNEIARMLNTLITKLKAKNQSTKH